MENIGTGRGYKRLKYLLAVGLVIVAIGGLIIARQTSKNNQTTVPTSSNTASQTKSSGRACTAFTLADAKQLLGSSASGGRSNSDTSSKDLAVSICVYNPNNGTAAAASVKTASLLVRSPSTEAGAKSNQQQFSNLKPVDSQDVAGYGQDAYWDPQYGQLNILKNNTWYILTYGSPIPADRTLDQTKQMADIIIAKI
jgi:hypothetical protein